MSNNFWDDEDSKPVEDAAPADSFWEADAAPPPPKVDKLESFVRGGFQGASLGFADELSGRLEQIGALAGLRGVGGGFDEIRMETDEEDQQPLSEIYQERRDKRRGQDKDAESANPLSYLGGNFVGGSFIPGAAGMKGASVAGAVLKGAGAGLATGGIQGLGDSEAQDGLGMAGDAARGAAFGTLAGGVAGGIFNVGGRALSKTGRQSLGDEIGAVRRGWNKKIPEESIASDFGYLGGKLPIKAWNAAKETIQGAKAQADFRQLIQGAKNNLISRMAEEGGPTDGPRAARSILDKMSDDEFVLRSLMDDGDNAVKQWVARSAASEAGQIDAGDYQSVLNMGTEGRNAARAFDPKAAGAELAPMVENTNRQMKSAIKSRVSDLSEEAGIGFNGFSEKLAEDTVRALEDADSMTTIPKSVKTRLTAGIELVLDGKAPSSYGLSKVNFIDADSSEQFRRLQKLRETLDLGIDWDAIKTGKRAMDEGEQILANLRRSVDDHLKTAPAKVQADAVYRLGKELRESVFKKTELKGGVDEYKLKRLLGNTDEANRFRQALDDLQDWASDPQYAAEAREAAKGLVQKFQALYKLADDSRQLSSFRWKQGPTSPAVERLGSQLNKNSLVQDAVRSPSSFVNSADQFAKNFAPEIAGKSYGQMNDVEKAAFVKLWVKAQGESQRGLSPTPEAMKDWYSRFMGKPNGSSLIGGTTVDSVKDMAINRAGQMALNEAYSSATGEEELPDPAKDYAVEYLQEKMGLTEDQAKALKKMMPGIYDLAGMAGRKMRLPKSNWRPNSVGERQSPLKGRPEKPLAKRGVRIDGKNYTHQVFRDGGEIRHYLYDGNTPVATVRTHLAEYDHYGDGDVARGVSVDWSQSDIKGKELGRRLYELVLDSHGTVISDESLSPDGSLKMYTSHYPSIEGVNVSHARKNTDERFVVESGYNNKNVRRPSKVKKWSDKEFDKINSDPDDDYILHRGNGEDDDYRSYDEDDEPSWSEEELQEKRDAEKRDEFSGEVRNIRNNRLRYRLKGEPYADESRDMAILAEHPKAEFLADKKAKALKEQDPAVFAERGSGSVNGLVDRLWLLQNSPRHQDSRVVAEAVERHRGALQDLLDYQKNQIGELRLSKQFGLVDNDKEIDEVWKAARRNPLYDEKTGKAFESHVVDPYEWADRSYGDERIEKMVALKNSSDPSHQKAFQRMLDEYGDRRDVRNAFDPKYRAKEAQQNLERNWRDYQTMLWKVQSGNLDRDGGTYTPERARQIIAEYEAEIPQEMKKTGARLPENWRELSFNGLIGPLVPNDVSADKARRIGAALNSTGEMRDQAIKAVAAFPNRDRLLNWIAHDGTDIPEEVIKAIYSVKFP